MIIGKRQSKKIFTLILGILIIGLGAIIEKQGWNDSIKPQIQQINQATTVGTYKIISIDDGDTVVVNMDGHKETIRFIGVDTPEVKDPRKPVQCFGKSASAFTKQLIGNHPVRLEADPENSNRDRYNRLLRYVYLPDGTLVNSEIIKQGYGFAYVGFPFTKKVEFKNLEDQARQANLGLWGGCQLTPNQYGGYTTNAEPNP